MKMKNFTKFLLAKTNWLIVSLMALLGFSCTNSEEDVDYPVAYGIPYAKYEVDLEVVDEAGNAQANQEVIIRHWLNDTSSNSWLYGISHENDTIRTDKNGKYNGEIEGSGFTEGVRFVVKEPVDETLEADSVNVVSEKVEEGWSWNQGKFKVIGRLKLKKKK